MDLTQAGIASAGSFTEIQAVIRSLNDTDSDGEGNSNLVEIEADAQPGWTGSAPVGVSGDLDPTTTTDDPPVADAGADVSGTVGVAIDFDGRGSTDDGTIVDYAWNFGDGGTANGDRVSYTYSSAGTYTVTLTVTDDIGQTGSDTAIATIDPPPAAPTADAGGPYTGIAGQAVAFDGSGSTDSDGNIVSYAWDFGDGTTGSGVSPSHTYASAGTYNVTLTVTDNDGLTDSAATTATIDPPPAAPTADAGGPYTGIAGQAVAFDGSGSTDSDGNIVSYAWDFGDGTTGSGVSPSHTYASAGTYNVTLTVTDNDGLTDSAATTATIDPPPAAPTADAGGPYTGTAGVALTFDGSGSTDSDGNIVSYAWDFGDGNTSTEMSPTHTYATGGLYNVTLTVTDNDDLTDTASTTADINNPPVSDPNGPYSGLAGEAINFDGRGSDDSDGTIVSYAWDFGDGNTGVGERPSHIYATAGTYDVSLTVTDNDGASDSASTTATITVDLIAPVADANGPYSGTVNDPVLFDGSGSSDADGNIVSYEWDFGDGNTGTGMNPAHTYTVTGAFDVALTVTDNDGLQSTDTTTATIGLGDLPPVADANGPYVGTVGVPVDFDGSGSTDQNGDIVSYDWEFGDGTFVADAGPTPSHTYNTDGIFTVTLTVIDATNLSDSDTTTATIEIELVPPVADPNGPYNGTAGVALSFDGSGSFDPDGGAITDYAWDFGDGNTGSGAQPSHTYASAGTYTVSLVVTDDDGQVSDAAQTSAEIVAAPEVPVADPNGPYSGKAGREVNFDGTASFDPDGGSITDYAWDFGDGNTGIGPTPTHVYANAATYTVTLMVTDDEGQESDPAATTAEIVPDEAPTADPNGPYSGVIDVPVSFDGSASFDPDGSIVAWDWDFGDNNSGSGETTSHVYTRADVYTVTLTVTDDFGNTASAETTATITEPALLPPVADAGGPYSGIEGETIVFDGGGSSDPDGNIVRYDWDFGDGTTAVDAGPNPTHVYTAAGVYNVSLTVVDNDGLMDSDATTAEIQPVTTDDADVFLTKMRVPSLLLLREDREIKKRILVYGDGSDIEQAATVTLSASNGGLEVEIEPETITQTVVPGGAATLFIFDAEIECEEPGDYVLSWTAVIDAADNAISTNDDLTVGTEVQCKARPSRRDTPPRRGRDDDDYDD
ncbi:MAG: PKD domain-containing protein [Gammaproteobacteria bacterium]|nr:PKD domain-containing protein [Gammaproteobacteria bacterium]